MKNNGESGHINVNYGIMSTEEIEVKKCKKCQYVHTIDNYYFDKVNNRFESYCKDCKSSHVRSNRQKDDTFMLKQEVYNLRYRVKQLTAQLKALKK